MSPQQLTVLAMIGMLWQCMLTHWKSIIGCQICTIALTKLLRFKKYLPMLTKVRAIWVVKFSSGGYKFRKTFAFRINIFKGNYWILRIRSMERHRERRQRQKLTPTVRTASFKNWSMFTEKLALLKYCLCSNWWERVARSPHAKKSKFLVNLDRLSKFLKISLSVVNALLSPIILSQVRLFSD